MGIFGGGGVGGAEIGDDLRFRLDALAVRVVQKRLDFVDRSERTVRPKRRQKKSISFSCQTFASFSLQVH